MRLILSQELRNQQTQHVAPRQIVASEILAWNGSEVEAAIEREAAENPALEKRDDYAFVAAEPAPYFPGYGAKPFGSAGDNLSPFTDPFDRVCGAVTLRDHLRNQIGLAASNVTDARIDGTLREIVAYLIECLDDRGYLAVDSEEIAERFGVRRGEVEQAIWALQTMEPAGVGARNLRECLCLQAESLRQSGDLPPLVYTILSQCWDDLIARRVERIGRRLTVPVATVRVALSALQHTLTPNPGASFRPPGGENGCGTGGDRAAIRPDIVFERTSEGLTATVTRLYEDAIAIAPDWRALAERHDGVCGSHSGHGGDTNAVDDRLCRYAREQVACAESFLGGLARRGATLHRIANALIAHQSGYLETGSRAFLHPLTRQALAEALHLDESVVSRAVAEKWARLPSGEVVALDAFFGGSHAIRDALTQLIANEDPRAPLSDEDLVDRLAAQGFDIARRTVAKYRSVEKILPARFRRRGATAEAGRMTAGSRQRERWVAA